MQRLPRHLGIHSGGMVICDRPVGEVCPVEWARTPGRTVLQWDKDDCAYAGLVKFDLLGLGMLAALHDCFDLVEKHYGPRWTMATIPQEDPVVYQMLTEADTVGVFQVESGLYGHLAPAAAAAVLRPGHRGRADPAGPDPGRLVHPYLRRRDGLEDAAMPHESMRAALGKTLGVPLFQEQMMQLAIDCAGFTPAEADRLRQAIRATIGAFGRHDEPHPTDPRSKRPGTPSNARSPSSRAKQGCHVLPSSNKPHALHAMQRYSV